MLDAGEKRIVRIGGRSKSEKLAGYQLKELARTKTSDESFSQRRIKQVHAQLFKLKEEIDKSIEAMQVVSWKGPYGGIRSLLGIDIPEIFALLSLPEMEADEVMVGPDGKQMKEDYLWKCWQNGEGMPQSIAYFGESYTSDLATAFWSLPLDERLSMIAEWRREILQPKVEEISHMTSEFNALLEQKQSLCHERELEILGQARIIGATTSGAAANRALLSAIAAGVVIVEEAGEVLEAHILTSLAADDVEGSGATKHLILIGDHKQLPPKVESYNLTTTSGCGYNLDCSLFERLVLSGRPSVALEVQHRMRPTISALIRDQTYPSLKDHGSVERYPDVKGVTEDVAFINHSFPEDGKDSDITTTKSNRFEAELSVELVRFFLLQGYRTSQIVVLTPYLGQLLGIIKLMSTKLKDVTALVSDRDAEDLDSLNGEEASSDLPSTSGGKGNEKSV
jgi:hypothetical protein